MTHTTKTNSKYVNPTGRGYEGVYTTDGYTVEVSVAAMNHINWTPRTDVVAIDDDTEPGVQLVEAGDHDTLGPCKMQDRGHGLLVHVHPPALRALNNFDGGDDVRVYRYDGGLTLVPRERDPFVGGDD